MSFNRFYAEILSPWLRRSVLGEKLDMALVAFNANLQFAGFAYANSGGKIFSPDEIRELFSGLDEASIEIAARFISRQYLCPPNSLMIHPKYFYTETEKDEYRRLLPDYLKTLRHYHFRKAEVGPESLYYHHGLRFAPEAVRKNIAGKIFADVGGYMGDSTLVFENYAPAKTVIFEPVPECREKLTCTMKRNRVPAGRYDLQPFGLSDVSGSFDNMECRRLDDISGKYDCPFGVLKADIEGMGLRFLLGAKETVLRDRPLLSLSIYHNEDEFTGIYRTLREWDIDYHIEIKSFSPLASHGEVSLFAYPAEWLK